MNSLPAAERESRLRELESIFNGILASTTTLQEFQSRLYSLLDDLCSLGHILGRWDYNCEVEYWGGDSYMDRTIPDELMLKSTYPTGVEFRWGSFDFDNG